MIDVFKSSPYVHVGGDEAYGVPESAQRDFIRKLNAFVRSKGKRTVVWEGPRLGKGANKVDTDVVHINWRTINVPAQAMLDAGYEVVNAAWDPFYIVDHYPRTMFTAVPVRRCYEVDLQRFAHVNHGIPTFARPHVTKTARGILGFCMPWWEGREENLFALCLPRLAAAASAAWNREGEQDFANFLTRQRRAMARLTEIADLELPRHPVADAETQSSNLAFGATVTASTGESQPHFSPARLTNGILDRFDHFLGYPTKPDPLEIRVALRAKGVVSRIRVYETAVGRSHELYEVFVSSDGETFERVGGTTKDSRGKRSYVDHTFPPRLVRWIEIRTRGCHGLTFPSFSRLVEVQAFAADR